MHPRVSHCIPCRLAGPLPSAPAPATAEARVIYGAVCCKTDWARHRLWQQSKWRASRDVGRERGRGKGQRVGQMICNALILRIITQIEIVEWQSKRLLLPLSFFSFWHCNCFFCFDCCLGKWDVKQQMGQQQTATTTASWAAHATWSCSLPDDFKSAPFTHTFCGTLSLSINK